MKPHKMSEIPFQLFKTPLLFSILVLLSLPFKVISQDSNPEITTLLSLKQQLGNPPFIQSWNCSSTSPCDWPGVNCVDGAVAGLQLGNINITETIPATICDLKNITFLNLTWNFIPGGFPKVLYNCTKLQFLDISQNFFVGLIPDDIDKLSSSLRYINLGGNNFTGNIPPQIGNLTELRTLFIYQNLFNGMFPKEIGKLSNLEQLGLAFNRFVPSRIPDEFGRLKNLKFLWIRAANLIGEIPESLSNLLSLKHLDLSENNLEGKIPDWLFFLKRLTFLLLNNNILMGEISSDLCNQKFLRILDLSHNGFSGSIPQCLGNFSNSLSVLHLGSNNFQGSIPSSFSEPSSLRYLNLNGNEIKGMIPSSIINCTSLEFLDLGNNMIEDAFPNFLGTLPQLQVLVLRSNKLHGFLKSPVSNFSFQKLQILDLSDNNFSGPLPVEYFSGFKAMTMVGQDMKYMGQKGDSGYSYSVTVTWKGTEIEFVKIQNALAIIDLSRNNFIGKIPSSIGRLKSLIQLNLSHNCFTGYIESSLGNLTNLEALDLSSNILTGRIPLQLVALSFLEVLNLSYNQLEGPIPIGKQFNTFEPSSYEGNLGLCGFPLPKECNNGVSQKLPPAQFQEETSMFEDGFGWKAVAIGYGCGVVFGLFVGCIVFITRKPSWFLRMIEGGRRPNEKAKRLRNSARRIGGRRN